MHRERKRERVFTSLIWIELPFRPSQNVHLPISVDNAANKHPGLYYKMERSTNWLWPHKSKVKESESWERLYCNNTTSLWGISTFWAGSGVCFGWPGFKGTRPSAVAVLWPLSNCGNSGDYDWAHVDGHKAVESSKKKGRETHGAALLCWRMHKGAKACRCVRRLLLRQQWWEN